MERGHSAGRNDSFAAWAEVADFHELELARLEDTAKTRDALRR